MPMITHHLSEVFTHLCKPLEQGVILLYEYPLHLGVCIVLVGPPNGGIHVRECVAQILHFHFVVVDTGKPGTGRAGRSGDVQVCCSLVVAKVEHNCTQAMPSIPIGPDDDDGF